jgi:glycosyltransferase involved in cell wall biosynthesis/GT2 family glycosyltransferase
MVHELELLRAVAPKHDITLLTTFWTIRPEALPLIQELGVRVEFVPWAWERTIGRRNRLLKFFRLVFGASPTFEIHRRRARLGPLVERIQREEAAHPYDVGFVIQGELAQVLDAITAPKALLLYDVYSRQTELVRKGLSLRALRYWLELRNSARWERSWYARADAIACVAQPDADAAKRMLGREIATIPNPIPEEFFEQPSVPRSSNIVTVIGSFGWEPNIDSVEWMCEEIWPIVKAARPDATLRVVGRFAFPKLIQMVEDAGGELLSDVPDIRPYYWEAAAVVANIRMGSGMRNKVLHAMACRAPLVATPSSLEGIKLAPEDVLLQAETSREIADAIVAILNDPSAAAARAAAAVDVAAQYSAAAAGTALESLWASIARPQARQDQPARSDALPLTATVVLCTRERPDLLRRSLASIHAALSGARADVVIVEQGTPHAKEICADLGLEAAVIADDGTGVSRARNTGVRAASGDVVLFTDDDCEVPQTWVEHHLEALSGSDAVASFGPVAGLRYDEQYDPAALPARHGTRSHPWMIGHASNMAVRVSAYRAAGGFDERIGPGRSAAPAGEDADLIYRLLSTGPIVSGTGEQVRHIDWRGNEDLRSNFLAYEHGAGVWIGKALRAQPRAATKQLVARVWMQRLAPAEPEEGKPVKRSELRRAFARGLLAGIRLKP